MRERTSASNWRLAARDIVKGAAAWNIWWPLGMTDIRQRYRRSGLGQLWIALSTGAFIAGIGLVYALLFQIDVHTYLPFLAVNYIVWTLIAGMLVDGTAVFVQAGAYLRQDAMPKSIFVLRVLVRGLLAFAHNLLVVPVVFIVFGVMPSWTMLLAIPGLILVLVAAYLLVLALGIFSTRYRDFPLLVQTALQIAFFMTPVMWSAEQIGDRGWYLIHFNPFTSLLWLVSEPLLGRIPAPETYGSALAIIGLLALLVWPLFARYRARIVYWL